VHVILEENFFDPKKGFLSRNCLALLLKLVTYFPEGFFPLILMLFPSILSFSFSGSHLNSFFSSEIGQAETFEKLLQRLFDISMLSSQARPLTGFSLLFSFLSFGFKLEFSVWFVCFNFRLA